MQNFIFIACKPGGKIGIYPRRNNLPFYAGKQCVENNHQNNTNKNARINWEKGSFIINGKASGISLYPFTSDDPPTDVIKEKSEITRTVTASNLIKGKKVNKIYSKRNLKRNGRTSVNIALPIGIGNKPQFFHIFNFIVTAN